MQGQPNYACFPPLLLTAENGPNVCTGCCSQMIFWHVHGSRSYVFGLFIDTRVVALLGLRTRRDLISGQVDYDLKGRQTLGA